MLTSSLSAAGEIPILVAGGGTLRKCSSLGPWESTLDDPHRQDRIMHQHMGGDGLCMEDLVSRSQVRSLELVAKL